MPHFYRICDLEIKDNNLIKGENMKGNNPINRNRSLRLIKVTLNFFLLFTLLVFETEIFSYTVQAQSVVNIVEGDVWRYFKGAEDPPYKWNHIGFDDSSWLSGPSGFGYGDGYYNTVLNDMQANYESIYVRREFTVSNPAAVTGITLSVVCDGPFKAYLNGIEVIRSNFQIYEELSISGFAHELFPSVNVLAIQCFNDDINSNNFSFMPSFKVF